MSLVAVRPAVAALAAPPGRDLRLDFFRGLALWFIFLDHIPSNVMSWLTVRNLGFSDATEIFFFVSGYSAALAYGGVMRRQGFLVGAARILRRCWQLYIAHIFLFVVFTAQIAYVATTFNNPMFSEEMNIVYFLNEPHVTLIQALLLKFKPANMDVLPVYIVLLAAFPPILWCLLKQPSQVLTLSVMVYTGARVLDWNLPAYPEGAVWYFNPFAWQLIFVGGAVLGRLHGRPWPVEPRPAVVLPAAIAYLVFALVIVLGWHLPQLGQLVPVWVGKLLYPIDKTNLGLVRLFHFLALAYLTTAIVRADAPFLRHPAARPIVRCGQHSLAVFCVGIFLSFAGHFVLVEIQSSIAAQFAVSITGIAIMIGVAYVISWYRAAERAPRPQPASYPAGAVKPGEATDDD